MPTTVTAAFREYSARLEPTEAQRSDASTKHTGLRECLDGSLWVTRAFLTGSYDRWTIVRPPNDVDLFVVLDYSKHGSEFLSSSDGAQTALARFHTRLKHCYPTTPIRKDHPSIRLAFATVGFDVIPAFARSGGGFLIPSPFGRGWIPTDPTKHAERTTAMNNATGNYFVPLVKMFKSWNYAHYGKLSGFHLEMALANAWPRVQSSTWPFPQVPVVYPSYSTAAAALLPALSAQLAYYTNDPAGLSGSIDQYLDLVDRRLTRARLTSAGQSALIARRHELREDHYSAIAKWRDIFGDPFPAYS